MQDWKTGDRVLAKWQDCKFYPAKVAKCLNDGKKHNNYFKTVFVDVRRRQNLWHLRHWQNSAKTWKAQFLQLPRV